MRMVKAKFAQEFVISEGDKDEGEKDEQHFWYEATKSQQDWLEKLIEIPTTGHEDVAEEFCQQDWQEK